uniref:Uncharacterized protein n=1 Tax=Rhipicephalus microplus TaxID=6941 RepID=A0A6G5ACC1_RHIMP
MAAVLHEEPVTGAGLGTRYGEGTRRWRSRPTYTASLTGRPEVGSVISRKSPGNFPPCPPKSPGYPRLLNGFPSPHVVPQPFTVDVPIPQPFEVPVPQPVPIHTLTEVTDTALIEPVTTAYVTEHGPMINQFQTQVPFMVY